MVDFYLEALGQAQPDRKWKLRNREILFQGQVDFQIYGYIYTFIISFILETLIEFSIEESLETSVPRETKFFL